MTTARGRGRRTTRGKRIAYIAVGGLLALGSVASLYATDYGQAVWGASAAAAVLASQLLRDPVWVYALAWVALLGLAIVTAFDGDFGLTAVVGLTEASMTVALVEAWQARAARPGPRLVGSSR